MVFDHTVPDVDYAEYPKQDWDNTVYANGRGELKEEVPTIKTRLIELGKQGDKVYS